MTVAQNIRDIATEARPHLEWQIKNLWGINLIFMSAFKGGFIDDFWNEFRPEHPGTWLHYFVRDRSLGDIKIGKTNSLTERICQLMTGAPRGVDLIACYPAPCSHEKELHEDFKHCRLNGEWFAPSTELIDYLEMIGADLEFRPWR